jgi:cytochrome c
MYRAEVNLQTMFAVSLNIIPKANGYIGFKQLDLTGIPQLEISAMALKMMGYLGGTIEVRLDKPDGELLGQVTIESKNPNFGGSAANAAQNSGGAKTKQSPTAPVAPKKPSTVNRKPSTTMGNPFAIPGIKTDIKPVSGLHDLYFVFKNENVKGDQPLMSVSNIKFNNVKQP